MKAKKNLLEKSPLRQSPSRVQLEKPEIGERKRSERCSNREQKAYEETRQIISSIAEQIDWATDGGNEPLDGFAAYGIAQLLEKVHSRLEIFPESDVR